MQSLSLRLSQQIRFQCQTRVQQKEKNSQRFFCFVLQKLFLCKMFWICELIRVLEGVCSCQDCKAACSENHHHIFTQNLEASNETTPAPSGISDDLEGADATSRQTEIWRIARLEAHVFIAIVLFLILSVLFAAVVVHECHTGTSTGRKFGRVLQGTHLFDLIWFDS